MTRKFKLTDDYIEKLTAKSEIKREKLELELAQNTDILVTITNDMRKILSDYKKANLDYKKLYADKYGYYSHQCEIVPENETEKRAMIESDDDIQESLQLIDEIDVDRQWMEDQRKNFQQKSWDCKHLIDWEKFKSGL